MSGVAALLLLSALLHQRGRQEPVEHLFAAAARSMAGEDVELVSKTKLLADGTKLAFLEIRGEMDELAGYAFHTQRIGGRAIGYGGKIVLAVMLDGDAAISGTRIIRSDETPWYLSRVKDWMKSLTGMGLAGVDPVAGVDSVTGATITSDAILQILSESGQRFAGQVLGMATGTQELSSTRPIDVRSLLFVGLVVVALVMRRRPTTRSRWLFLAFATLVLGFHLNVQYSVAHVFSLLSLRVPPMMVGAPFLLVVVVPILVLLFGNFYCGYLCPFGALQELVGRLHRFVPRIGPDQKTVQYGRLVKYLLLFVFVSLFALSLDTSLASSDLLVTVFGGSRTRFGIAATILVLALAIPYGRFWCRNLCPSGAFLSLLNGVHLLKRYIPAINPGLCEFGVSNVQELDCLCCDRCRLPDASTPASGSSGKKRNMIFIILIAVLAGLLARETAAAWRQGRVLLSAHRLQGVEGKARDADMVKLRRLIETKMLSDHEAVHYKTAPSPVRE